MLCELRDILAIAEERGCAVPAFNVYNGDTVRGIIQAAEMTNACVILQMYSRLFINDDAEFIAPSLIKAAENSSAKIVFHLDHGMSDEAVFRALRFGATGVMRDASTLPLDENISALKRIVGIAHACGTGVEGEVGHIPSATDGEIGDYTAIEDAVRFTQETGVDALAIQVGTAHGYYKKPPRLAIGRIYEINKAVSAFLVLHGGSGIPDDQIRDAVKNGIRKVNFGTDVCHAYLGAMREIERTISAVDLYIKPAVEAVKQYAIMKIKLLGAEDSAI